MADVKPKEGAPPHEQLDRPKQGSVAAIVLTYNEEERVRDCLKTLTWCDEVWVLDSYSTDKTRDICLEYTDNFSEHPFENFGLQRNWALDNLSEPERALPTTAKFPTPIPIIGALCHA